jgi:outer membrane biosynthesis protein TonB
MSERDDLNTPLVALVGVLGTLLVFVIVLFLAVLYRRVETQQQYDKDVSQPYTEVADLANRQRGSLASYGWVDQEKGIVAIPIGRAIDLAVREIRTEGRAAVTGPDETAAEETPPGETPPEDAPPNEKNGPPPAEPEEPQTTDTPEGASHAKPE